MPELVDLECAAGRQIVRPYSYGGLNWATPCEWVAIEVLRVRYGRMALCQQHLEVMLDDLNAVMVGVQRGAFPDWRVIGNPRVN